MKRIFLALMILALAQTVSAQDWAKAALAKSPRHSEWVTVKHDGRSVDTFVVYPESKDKRPVVMIIHEIFGMSDWVQDLADQVAAAGYIAVAPDLLSGMGPDGGRSSSFAEGKTMEAVSKLNPDQVTADLNAVADYGEQDPRVERQTVRWRILLGRRTDVPLRHESRRPVSRIRFLRPAARQRRDDAHQSPRLRIFRRQRRAHRRNDSRRHRKHESRWKNI